MPVAGTNWHMAAGVPVGAVDDGEEQPGVAGVEDPAQHHGEAALVLTTAAQAHQRDELGGECRVESGRVVEGGGIAVLLDSVVGLAQALHAASGQGELLDVHHCLVADVDVVHPRVSVDGQPLLAGAHDGRHPTVIVGEPAERPPYLFAFVARSDRVGGDQADPSVDGVGHQAVPMEEPLLVGAEGEVVEGALRRAGARCPGPGTRRPVPRSVGGRPPGRVNKNKATPTRPMPMASRLGARNRSDRVGKGIGGRRPCARPPPSTPCTHEMLEPVVAAEVGGDLDGDGGADGDSHRPAHQGHDRRPQR